MANTRGTTRTSPQDHKPKQLSKAEQRRREAYSLAYMDKDNLDERGKALRVTVHLDTALGEDDIDVLSAIDWDYDAGEALEQGYLAKWAHSALAKDDGVTFDPDDDETVPDDEIVAGDRLSSLERFKALKPTTGDVIRFVDRWREANDDAAGKLSAS